MHPEQLENQERLILVKLTRQALEYAVRHRNILEIGAEFDHNHLNAPAACFVTLHIGDQLRGCVGSVEAYRPLFEDIAENAFNAARRDPRFNPVTKSELKHIRISLSLLTTPEEIKFHDEADLRQQIVPGCDGLILEEGRRRGLFLPAVWEQIPKIDDFLSHLKRKAGLPDNYLSADMVVKRFHAIEIEEDES
jgi:hypothetical protein